MFIRKIYKYMVRVREWYEIVKYTPFHGMFYGENEVLNLVLSFNTCSKKKT